LALIAALAAASAPFACGDGASEPTAVPVTSPAANVALGDMAAGAPTSAMASGPSATQPSSPPVASSPTTASPARPPVAFSPTAGAAVSSVLARVVERGDSPGVVGLVVDRQGVLFEGAAGLLNVADGEAMPVDAIFSIASMTKPVTSVAIMQLVERGRLGLDDPVSKFLSGFDELEVLTSIDPVTGSFETRPAATVMTVRHLLSHTSGIGYGFSNSTVAQLQRGTQVPEWQLPLLSEPGSEWHYGASTRLLGQIVEAISGQSLEAYFQAEILAPLGMSDTSFAVPEAKRARVPTLHVRTAGGGLQESTQNGIPSTPTPPFAGDGGLYSTARDYGQFMRMLLNGGALGEARILSEGSVALMGENQIGEIFVAEQEAANPALTQPFPLGAGIDKFGLGFQITGTDAADRPRRSAGSLSWAGLFNTEFWIDPREGVAATLLMQVLPFYDDGAIAALQDFETTLYRELVRRPK
jgi:CubicO group peptidase (beta-lactamase class C family)